MENQQISSDFPIVDIWIEYDNNQLVNVDHVYNFQGSNTTLSNKHAINGFFIDLFEPFTESINIKKRGIDNVDSNHINLIIVPCPHYNNLDNVLKKITSDVYGWCEYNKVKIAICLTRETIYNLDLDYIDSIIQLYLVNRGFKSSVVKIINNSYGDLPGLNNSSYIVSVDTIRRTLKSFTKDWIQPTSLPEERTYKFSLLTGAVYQRRNRVLFLSECYKQNLLTDKFFYSVCMLDEDRDLDYVQRIAIECSNPFILKACDSVFKHKTYAVDGSLLKDVSIYDDRVEFFIPPQVLDSYIHIVLETVDHVPSVTEKIFKPIMAGLPFIWHGCPNLLPYLESLGFKRYSHIDYSFDCDPDPEKRLYLLIEEIQRLNKMDLKMIVQSNAEISKHNQQVFDLITRDYNDLWKHLK